MIDKRILILFLFCCTSILAQLKGKVVDEKNQPIPYVNIGVQNEAMGTTSEEDGTFYLPLKETKNLVFSALGYEKRVVKSDAAHTVQLQSTTYTLHEITVLNKKETRVMETGSGEGIAQAFESGPKMDARFFSYNSKIKKHRYIKRVSLFTESNLEEATVKLHFYTVTPEGLPGEEMVAKDLLFQVKKGSRKTYFDVSKYNLSFPKEGLFVAVERLFIEKNKYTKEVATSEVGKTKTLTVYYPLLFYNYTVKEYSYTFYGGSWHKEYKPSKDSSVPTRIFEPAISLILTN